MPDLLGALIQLLQQLNEAKLGWLANIALILITLLSLLFFTSYVLLSPRVVTLFKIIATIFKQSKPKLSEAFSSPYDIDLLENRIFIGFAAFFYYTYMIFFLLYAFLFLGIASGFATEGELSLFKRILAIAFVFLFFMLARYFKCQGDKELFKILRKKAT